MKNFYLLLFFYLNSISQHIIHHQFQMQNSVVYQLHITPSAHYITCPPECSSPSYPICPPTSPPATLSLFPIVKSLSWFFSLSEIFFDLYTIRKSMRCRIFYSLIHFVHSFYKYSALTIYLALDLLLGNRQSNGCFEESKQLQSQVI